MLKKHKKLTKKEMKKDPFLIFTAQVVDYIRDEWIKIASIVFGVIFIVALSLFLVKTKNASELKMYDVAINAFTTNQPEAIDLLVKFADKYSGSGNAEAVMLKLGNHYFAEKNYESAEKYYSEYIKKYSGNPIYGLNAYCGLGGIYEEQGEFAKAGELYESFVAKYKDSTFLPMMRLNAGKAYYSAGENESARDNFNVIINEFGNSQENQEALFYLEMISNGTTGA